MPRQAAVACVSASAASAAGAPGPAGSFISGAPHDAAKAQRRTTSATGARQAVHFLGSFCFAAWIFLSTSALSIESPSPASARSRRRSPRRSVQLEQHLAVVILDHRVGLAAGRRRASGCLGEIELVGLEVGPAEAVEIRPVLGLDLQRPLQIARPTRRAARRARPACSRDSSARSRSRDRATAPGGTPTPLRRTSSACRAPCRARTRSPSSVGNLPCASCSTFTACAPRSASE